jgi:hypothetical protein
MIEMLFTRRFETPYYNYNKIVVCYSPKARVT